MADHKEYDEGIIDALRAIADGSFAENLNKWHRSAIFAAMTATAVIRRLTKERDEARAESERLRADLRANSESMSTCEGCGAPLHPGDDYVTDPGDVHGCWPTMTDVPSKRPRPCYAYRVGKQGGAMPPSGTIPAAKPDQEAGAIPSGKTEDADARD